MSDKLDHLTEEQWDAYIETTLKTLYERIEVPDKEAAWQRISAQLTAMEKARKKRQSWLYSALAIAAVAVIFVAVGMKLLAEVNQEQPLVIVSEPFEHILNNDYEIIPHEFKQVTMNEREHTLVPHIITIDEAGRKIEFSIYIPKYIPAAFTFSKIKAYQDLDYVYRNVQLEYVNQFGQSLNVIERKVTSQSIPRPFPIEMKYEEREITINGNKGVLTIGANGISRIDWIENNVMFTVFGEVREEEIIRFATSLRES